MSPNSTGPRLDILNLPPLCSVLQHHRHVYNHYAASTSSENRRTQWCAGDCPEVALMLPVGNEGVAKNMETTNLRFEI